MPLAYVQSMTESEDIETSTRVQAEETEDDEEAPVATSTRVEE